MKLYFLIVQALRHYYDGSLQPGFAYATGVFYSDREALEACVELGEREFPTHDNWSNFSYKAVPVQGPYTYGNKYIVTVNIQEL